MRLIPTMTAFFFIAVIILFTSSSVLADHTNPFSTNKSDISTYIVHVAKVNSQLATEDERNDYYRSFLPLSVETTDRLGIMVHTYHNVMSGFAAKLTEEEVQEMQKNDGFIFAAKERILQLHTTHTPNFLGLHPDTGFWKSSNFGKGVIVGMLDSGVFPSHPSFNDQGMPPPPAKWKGRCDFQASDCNNKLIGAKSMMSSSTAKSSAAKSPLDDDGHGTHTASTAAGSFVMNAEVLGNAFGTASGMAPMAHLAIYKVCSEDGCTEADILAGMDAAVADGVDVISMSLGGPSQPFYADNIAIGAFGAIQKGVFVSCSAANAGPEHSTLSNDAPWILTVGASTMDRTILSTAKLGNGQEFAGESLFQPKDYPSTLMPLVYAGANGNTNFAFCGEGSLGWMDLKGKIVLCERGGNVARIDKGVEVKKAGGAAMILMNSEADAFSTLADAHVLPASHVSFADGQKIKAYISSSKSPMATVIFNGTVIGSSSSPVVTSFSSRGPSVITPGILKPDIIGPGVSVLAAWPFALDNSTSKSTFNIISGTSMSCPHLGGIAALLKSAHPDWSPAAIKSAIMTTADLQNLGGKPILDEKLEPADLFATGAGHVNPSKASNPGLVYDIQPSDYIPYMCGLGYTDKEVSVIAHQSVKCKLQPTISEGELNYPSFTVTFGDYRQTFHRTVTNVGEASSTYKVTVSPPQGVSVMVNPEELVFIETNQKLTYSVQFYKVVTEVGKQPFAQGFLKWDSSTHSVRSPISVAFA